MSYLNNNFLYIIILFLIGLVSYTTNIDNFMDLPLWPDVQTYQSIANNSIILFFSILSLFLESIVIIISLLKKGIIKKEILSEKTNLGFDLVIKRK